MEFRILGPLEVLRDGQPVPVRSGKQRVLLASLLLRANQLVSSHELIDRLWPDGSVSRPQDTLYQCVMRLRRTLGSHGVLRTIPGGYLMAVASDRLDLSRFEDSVAQSGRLGAAGDLAGELNALGEALSLWRGPALLDVPSDSLRQVYGERLAEQRLRVVERRLEIHLRLGRHEEVIGELLGLTREHPLRESLWRQLLVALGRSGRHAEALDAYQAIRQRLADELGVDPNRELQDLYRAVLRGELEPLARYVSGSLTHWIVPRQLPADAADFVGRAREVARLRRLLSDAQSTMAVLAVSGGASVGKSTLTVHVAHQLRESFPDGQLYVDLHGTSADPAQPADVLARFLRDLGVPDSAIPDRLEQRAALYRSMLPDRRILIVLDNAVDEAQVQALLPGVSTCLVLITSRTRLTGIAGAGQVELDVFDSAEAVDLLGRVAGTARVASEPDRARELVILCGWLPLAVRIAAARLAAKPHWTLGDLVTRLADERRRLDELTHGKMQVRTGLESSYLRLDRVAQQMFRRLGLLDAPDLAAPDAAALLGMSLPAADEIVERLVDARLLEVAGRDELGRPCYRFPGLTRTYARELAEAEDQPDEQADLRPGRGHADLRAQLWHNSIHERRLRTG